MNNERGVSLCACQLPSWLDRSQVSTYRVAMSTTEGQALMRYAADDDGWQEGDYAVDHGHVDDFYAPSAAQRESEAIRLECLAEERAPKRDSVLVTRPAYGEAGRS